MGLGFIQICLTRKGGKEPKQKILHDERIFFYKDDLVLAHMGANCFKLFIPLIELKIFLNSYD